MGNRAADSGEVRSFRPSLVPASCRTIFGTSARQQAPTVQGALPREAGHWARRDRVNKTSPMNTPLGESIAFGSFRLYPSARALERGGARLAVGSRALDILIVLTEHAGEVVSHKELIRRVWRGLVVTPSSLRVHVAGLRKVLSERLGSSRYIANVPGQGYCFVAPIRRFALKDLSVLCPERPEPAPPLSDPSPNSVEGEPPIAQVASPEGAGLQPTWRKGNRSGPLMGPIGCDKESRPLKILLIHGRLMTLTGVGETSKTWLTMQINAETWNGVPAGHWFVELASLGDPGRAVQTAANVLRITGRGSSSLAEAVTEHIAAKCLFVVLDSDDR
jgi:DNA-binding winged helix-turn-helix (wHTH) protein